MLIQNGKLSELLYKGFPVLFIGKQLTRTVLKLTEHCDQ